uniref:CCHC-type domain-containing protein n=1 Tax=Ditylenchus dipsaci TaxID=166011 RepID=A0A915CX88_9BILA
MSSSRGGFSRGGGQRGGGRGGPSRGRGGSSYPTAVECFKCHKTGHMSRECPEAAPSQGSSYARGGGQSDRGSYQQRGGTGGYRGDRRTADHSNEEVDQETMVAVEQEPLKKPLKELVTVQAVDTRKPSGGTLGRAVKLVVNYFKMTYESMKARGIKSKAIKNRKVLREYFWQFVAQNQNLFGVAQNLLYDDRSQLYSWIKLEINADILSLELEVVEDGRNRVMLLEIKPRESNSPIRVDFNILNLALTQFARSLSPRVYCEKDRIFMLPCQEYQPLDLNYWVALANYDVVHSSFYKTNVEILQFYSMVKTGQQLTERHLRDLRDFGLDNPQRREMKMLLSGLKLKARVGLISTYSFCDVSQQSARQAIVNYKMYNDAGELSREENMTVEEYYFKRYGVRLDFPNMPLIQCAPKDKNIFIPMEALVIHDRPQRLRSKLPDDLQARTNSFTSREPKFRFNDINEIMGSVEVGQDPFLVQADIGVDLRMLEIEGRVLNQPKCTFNLPFGAQMKAPAVEAPNFKVVFSVVVVNRCVRFDDHFRNSIANLIEDCQKRGIQFAQNNPLEALEYQYNPNTLNQYLQDRKKESAKIYPQAQLMLIVVVGTADDKIYNALKTECEVKLGMMTQVLLSKTFRKLNDRPALQNSPNTQHWKKFTDPKHPTLFIGIDVTHSAPGDTDFPSISALVGSIDVEATKYASTVRAQGIRTEAIEDMKEMSKERILHFRKLNHTLPAHIVVFRDGVSESQFEQVIRQELVQKRHSTRFYAPSEDTGERGRNGNCLPGTVVDKYITSDQAKEFYLCAHKGMLGTSRPAHYYVISDDWGLNPNEVQSCAYNLCHLFARAAMPVSLPAPVYYAHLVCYRARRHLTAQRDSRNRPTDFQQMVQVKENIKDEMHFKILMAVLNSLYLQAFAKQEPSAKTKDSIQNDKNLYQLKKKALKKMHKYEQKDQEEDDNEDLAYLNFALIWPVGITSLISIGFFLLSFASMEMVEHLGFELYAVNQYAITYGKSILLCNNTVPYQKGMLPSFLRQLEIKVTTNMFLRASVCVPMTIRIFVAWCIRKTVYEQPLTQKNPLVAYLNDAAAVIAVVEVLSLALLSMVTIRFDYPKLFKLMFGSFILSASIYMSVRTMLSIVVEKNEPIEHLGAL